jgi:hypothetical protein
MVSPPGVEKRVVLDENKTRKGFSRVLSFSEARRLGRLFDVCDIWISRQACVCQMLTLLGVRNLGLLSGKRGQMARRPTYLGLQVLRVMAAVLVLITHSGFYASERLDHSIKY